MQESTPFEYQEVYRQGLLSDTLPFWLAHSVDDEYGGFITALDRDGSILDTDKGVWQQGRFTWLLGELYNNVQPRDKWLQLARHGIDFIDQHCIDPDDGRLWFQVARDGRPIRKRRYAFGEAFAAMAFGEYAQATGSDEAAQRAAGLFRSFLKQNENPEPGTAKFTDTRPTKAIGPPMIAINVAQQLRDSIDLPDATNQIDRAIEEIERDFLKPDIQCVMETVAPDGQIVDHFDGRTLNPGHAIEGAWFILAEGMHRGDEGLVTMGCHMLEWMWDRGWDRENGGLFYFRDVDNKPVPEYWHDMKFWWPHNETIIATLLAWLLTRDSRYANWHRQVHEWSYAHFPDTEHGEWFGYLHHDGGLSVPLKGNLWKGPFHLPRMQLVCWKLLEEFSAVAPDDE